MICEKCSMIPCVCDSLVSPDISTPPPQTSAEDFILRFGKHNGKALAQILIDDGGYLSWLQKQKWLHDDVRMAVNTMNEKYSHEIEEACEKKREEYWRNQRGRGQGRYSND